MLNIYCYKSRGRWLSLRPKTAFGMHLGVLKLLQWTNCRVFTLAWFDTVGYGGLAKWELLWESERTWKKKKRTKLETKRGLEGKTQLVFLNVDFEEGGKKDYYSTSGKEEFRLRVVILIMISPLTSHSALGGKKRKRRTVLLLTILPLASPRVCTPRRSSIVWLVWSPRPTWSFSSLSLFTSPSL